MIDALFDRTYHKQRYNCVHLVCDAWHLVTGADLSQRMAGVLRAVSDGSGLQRDDMRPFERMTEPESPCIVLMHGRSPHVGLFYRQRVLHITEQGVQYMPLAVAAIGFDRVRFYR